MASSTDMSRFHSLSLGGNEAGLFSYAQIVHLLKAEFARARRYQIPLACFVVRLDRLDSLRDLYGFRAKGFILDRVVRVLRREIRACDVLGQAPDDQLLLIAPHTDREGAQAMAERLRTTIADCEFEVEGKAIRVTLSFGGAIYQERNTLFYDALVYAAEEAADQVLRAGGNAVLFREPGGDADDGDDRLDLDQS
ncbi:MAG: GGDEF domain-containing protein [Planctomycetes bacterium]|nr:GGDEF domain-containing protein [Planctomycetota bacterium]